MDTTTRRLIDEAVQVIDRYTTGSVTGFCAACYDIAVMRGGRVPNVLDGEAHRRGCPINRFRRRALRAMG